VYLFSPSSPSAYEVADGLWLARAPITGLFDRDAWTFFSGLEADGSPRWSDEPSAAATVLDLPGRIYRPSAVYNPGIGRVLLTTTVNLSVADANAMQVLAAPAPWGPWESVYRNEEFDRQWPDERASLPFHAQFPPKWISGDGRSLYLAFSCCPDTPGYAFNVVGARLVAR
jgi:hypothetical protein